MKYPDYNLKSMQEILDTYANINNGSVPWAFENKGITIDSSEYNLENYARLYDEETTKLSRKDFVKLLVEIKNTGLISDASISVIDKLIGDRKLYKKIKFCFDGSFRNNRIWGHAEDGVYKIEPMVTHYLEDAKYIPKFKNEKEYIDWLYNHFDTIFVMLPMWKASRFIESDVEESLEPSYDYDYEFDDYDLEEGFGCHVEADCPLNDEEEY